ncbi:MAG TPA: tetratricopeptide repeat protein [Bryobacteraceae bacterium]|nr:tetratricopeptide repeat protein [Bryobacteraceae bacterium]
MSQILDQGSLLFASLAVLAASLFLQSSLRQVIQQAPVAIEHTPSPEAVQGEPNIPVVPVRPRWSFAFYSPLLVLAVVYVPGTLLVTRLIGRLGGFGVVFQRDYSSLLTCTSMAWAAVNLPLALIAMVVPPPVLAAVAALAYLYFAVLMFFAVRTVLGTENGVTAAAIGLSVIPLAASVFFWAPLRLILSYLASPFFLFYAFYYLRGEFTNIGSGLRSRQSFHRMLETSAVNPHDAEAQYQLGLVYQQRRQYPEAIQRFKNAAAINQAETDAHFQLGRIAREQGRLKDALTHFQTVLDQDEKHNLSEILREIGATYLAARQYEDARRELAEYIERRPYDAEGLYYYGHALENLNRTDEAREAYARSIESARTAPQYRRRYTARWSRLAQKQLRKLGRKS